MARVEALCISERKGERKRAVASATFRADFGIEGDAHAGTWHRQVSLLSAADVDEVREKGVRHLLPVGPKGACAQKVPDPFFPKPGDFAENVILSGLDFSTVGLGTRLRLGRSVILSVTQIGKVCHAPCEIARATGDCIMPRRGLFARVEAGGTAAVGDPAEVVSLVGRDVFQAVVLTVSDRCSRGEATDTAGPAVAKRLSEKLRAHVYRAEIVPDEREAIAGRLRHYSDGHGIDLVVTVGGTGFAPRDVTPEATRAVVERPAPGLDEAMRAASLAKTPHASLSRGASGIRGATLIVNLPGSERAAVENLDAILDALPHGIEKLRGDPSDCGRAPVGKRTGGQAASGTQDPA